MIPLQVQETSVSSESQSPGKFIENMVMIYFHTPECGKAHGGIDLKYK